MTDGDDDDMIFDNYEPLECPICGAEMEVESCWACHGSGGFHDCGEDCCCCADPEEITHFCNECHGEGDYLVCQALPHTEEQIDAYRLRTKDQL